MSDYYDYVIHCELPHTVPQQIVDTLQYMTRVSDYSFDSPPDHPFFEAGEKDLGEPWRIILRPDPNEDLGYFARFFRLDSPRYEWGPDYDPPYVLDFRLNIQDDAEGDIWNLLRWLASVSQTRGFVGYSLLQDGGFSHPTLWYFRDGQLLRYRVTTANGALDISA